MIVVIAAILLLLLLFLNVPVYISLVTAALEYFFFSDVNIMILVQKMARAWKIPLCWPFHFSFALVF